MPTSLATSRTALPLLSSALPFPATAQRRFQQPWAQEPVRPDTGRAHPGSTIPFCLVLPGSSDLTQNCASVACPANFLLFSFQQNPPAPSPNSLAQILALLSLTNSQPLAAHLTSVPRANSACAAAGSPLGTPATPSRGTHRSAPGSAARGRVPRLRATKTCPWCRSEPREQASGAGGSRRWGPAEDGARRLA